MSTAPLPAPGADRPRKLDEIKEFTRVLVRGTVRAFQGGVAYQAWLLVLLALSVAGLHAYAKQLTHGLAVTGMSDQVSWGIYIANFVFLVGMACASVTIVIPAYIYRDEEMRGIVIFSILMGLATVVGALLFVLVDIGRPDAFWHMIPGIGKFHFPISMLSWDVIVLNGYLVLNAFICWYMLFAAWRHKKPAAGFYLPLVFLAMAWSISTLAVDAFLFVGLGSRPYWNSAILGPRFVAAAFAAGPGALILSLQVVRATFGYPVPDSVLFKLRGIVQVAMIVNAFLLICEVFTEFYTDSYHVASVTYLYFGLHGHNDLVPWIWTAIALNLLALVLLMTPASFDLRALNVACVAAIFGIWIDKAMGLIVPGFVPTPLGEVVEYTPSLNESLVSFGIWAFVLLLFTVMLRVAVPILYSEVRHTQAAAPDPGPVASAG